MVPNNNSERGKWMEKVLSSASRKQPLAYDPQFYDKVQTRLRISQPTVSIHIGRYAKQAAAAAVLLFLLNIASILRATKSTSTQQNTQVLTLLQSDFENLSTY
jgi:hypothetical protein